MPDRTHERAALERRRAEERVARARVEYELLDVPHLDGRQLTALALRRLQELIGRTLAKLGTRAVIGECIDGPLKCRIERTPGENTHLHVEGGGTLTLLNLTVSIRPVATPAIQKTPEALTDAL
jgi:hypothetical protein